MVARPPSAGERGWGDVLYSSCSELVAPRFARIGRDRNTAGLSVGGVSSRCKANASGGMDRQRLTKEDLMHKHVRVWECAWAHLPRESPYEEHTRFPRAFPYAFSLCSSKSLTYLYRIMHGRKGGTQQSLYQIVEKIHKGVPLVRTGRGVETTSERAKGRLHLRTVAIPKDVLYNSPRSLNNP